MTFQPSFFNFLNDLASNNSKDWFDANRTRYEKELKLPFEIFAIELLNKLLEIDNELLPDAKKCIFRINRDIRFSKDKTPYKINRSLAFSKQGKKDTENPGYYLELSPQKCFIAGGAYFPSREHLKKIRQEIYYNSDEFETLLNEENFKNYFGNLTGTRAKRLTGAEADYAAEMDFLFQTQYYFYNEFSYKECLKPNFLDFIFQRFSAGFPINQFLRRAMRD